MSTRKQSPEMLKVLSHPSRIALYELIRDGINTAPQMAEVLGENRLNLYHHLAKLEQVNLIQSSYGPDRVKIYELVDETISQQIQEASDFEKEDTTANYSFILTAPRDPSKGRKNRKLAFATHVQKLAELANVPLPPDIEILQVQIIAQPKSIVVKRNKMMKEILDEMQE